MPYGTGQPLMAGFDPSTLRQDFSGFVNAAAIRGQTMAGIGQSIANVANIYQQNKKESATLNAQAKTAENYLQSAKTTFAGVLPEEAAAGIDELLAQANSPGVSTFERASLLSAGQQGVQQQIEMLLMRDKMTMQQERLSQLQARGAPSSGGGGGGGAAPVVPSAPSAPSYGWSDSGYTVE